MNKFVIFLSICGFAAVASDGVPKKAVAVVVGTNIKGNITLTQASCQNFLEVDVEIIGLTPGLHGFHVHEFGDLSGGCGTLGAHYNPLKNTHGAINDKNRHAGDWGNIEADANGVVSYRFIDEVATLYGLYSIVGRGIVVHERRDDLGKTNHPDSPKTGDAGGRVACGVIGIAS